MELPVKVQIRIKPSDGFEDDSVIPISSTKVEFNHDKEFTFDHVFRADADQNEVFQKSALPLLERFFEGFNATMMAYGPTGSGKSYTLGTHGSKIDGEQRGLLFLIFDWIFSKLDEDRENSASSIKISFLEIYKEELYDLLQQTNHTRVEIKNSDKDNVVIENVTERVVCSKHEAVRLVHQANYRRQVKKTLANDYSSRSHAIVTITLSKGDRQSTIRIVDLAGSEAVAKDGVCGEVKSEGIFINKGLLALGKVITALNSKNTTHVPYRESVLTRALRDSLSGNSLTVLICCVKASSQNIAATSNTLQFAAQARALKTRVIYSSFKTPGPSRAFKTPSRTPARTPLSQLTTNRVVTPGGSSFALPAKFRGPPKEIYDPDESILVSGCHLDGPVRPSSFEDRFQTAALEKLEALLDEFRDRLSQSFINRSVTERNSILKSQTVVSNAEVSSRVLSDTWNESQVGPRRRSARLAQKSLNQTAQSNQSWTNRTSVASRKIPAVPVPTPEGSEPEDLDRYRARILEFVNQATVQQLQKLATVGPKAAQSLHNYRILKGPYSDLESIRHVPGLRRNFYLDFRKANLLDF